MACRIWNISAILFEDFVIAPAAHSALLSATFVLLTLVSVSLQWADTPSELMAFRAIAYSCIAGRRGVNC